MGRINKETVQDLPCDAITDILQFLTKLFHSGIGYSCSNTLSAVRVFLDNRSAGGHPLFVTFIKAIFNRRPSLPKYTSTWEVNVVLECLHKFECLKNFH